GSGVTANALHPGMVSTSFGAEDPGRIQRLLVPLIRPLMKSPVRGAVTSVHLASAPDVERVSGRYFAAGRPRRSSARSYDEDIAARLWGGERGPRRPDRGRPWVRSPVTR
ncbi:MAG: hypothetical protein L0K86_24235, partial [Actinomycetia bacterium]|nr:hypothetical protein [Actinomycetes bacterium]